MKESDFLTTQWTQVLAATGDSEDARSALSSLADCYYSPVVAFLQKEGRNQDAARELAHSFFAWLLSRDAFTRLDRSRGRFRSYLLGALKHFVNHEREKAGRKKRGAGASHIPVGTKDDASPNIDPQDAITLPPDREFDRQWALHVLSEAMAALEAEWKDAGKENQFTQLRPYLDGEAVHGEMADFAVTTGSNVNTLRSTLRRLRYRFRQHVKAQIAPTLAEGDDVSSEMEVLFAALAGR